MHEPPKTNPAYVDTAGAAALLGLSRSNLEKRRFFGDDGPPFAKIGRRVLYPVDGLRDWMDSQVRRGSRDRSSD